MADATGIERFAPNEDWLKLSQAFRGMFWPIFLIGLDFHFRLNSIKFSLLPAALGWFWMYRALGPVALLSPMLQLLRRLALCLILLQLPYVIQIVDRPIRSGVRFNLPELPTMDYWTWSWGQWSSLTSLMSALFLWCLAGVIIKLAVSKDNRWLAVRARFRRILYVIPVVLLPWLTALAHVSWTSFVGVVIVYGLVVVVAIFLYAAMNSLAASFCREQAFADDGLPPDFSGKESSALENALRTDDPQKPFRFSLWTIILLMTVIGMASSQIHLIRASQQSSQSLATAQEEAAFYRKQLERLLVFDKGKVFAKEIRNQDPLLWEWRIYVPEDGLFEIKAKFNDFPNRGIPEGATDLAVRIPGGTSSVSLQIDDSRGEHGSAKLNVLWDNPRGGERITISRGRKTVEKLGTRTYDGEHMLTPDQAEFYVAGSWGTTSDIDWDGRASAGVDKPIVFFKFINHDKSPPQQGNQSPSGKGTVGMVLWIEKVGP